MEHGLVKPGITVAVAGLDAIPRNYGSFKDVPAFAAPHIFKPEWFKNRQDRVGQAGEVQGFCIGHVNAIWRVLHGDNSIAIYHHSELVLPADLEAELEKRAKATEAAAAETVDAEAPVQGTVVGDTVAAAPALASAEAVAPDAGQAEGGSPLDEFTQRVVVPVGSTEPFMKETVRGTTVEAYLGLDPTKMEGDVLIAPFLLGVSLPAQLDLQLHKQIRSVAGEWFHDQIIGLGDQFAEFDTAHVPSPNGEKAVPFKGVVFVHGTEPTADAIAQAFLCAHEAKAKTVILTIPAFFPNFTGMFNADALVRAVMLILERLADIRGTDFEVVKVVF